MKIDCISDSHNRLTISDLEFTDAEMLIIAGDISGCGAVWETTAILNRLDAMPHKHIILVPGNHDGAFQEYPKSIPETRVIIETHGIITIEGLRIACSSWTPEFCGWHFMKQDKDLAEMWEEFKDQNIDILVTHGPAYGILDSNPKDGHCGSKTLLEALPDIAPRYHILGHIHGSYGSHEENGIQFRNVSLLNEQYIHTNPVTTIEV